MERWKGKPLQCFFRFPFDALIKKRRARVGANRRDGQKTFRSALFRQRRGAQRIFVVDLNELLLCFRLFPRRSEAAKDIVNAKKYRSYDSSRAKSATTCCNFSCSNGSGVRTKMVTCRYKSDCSSKASNSPPTKPLAPSKRAVLRSNAKTSKAKHSSFIIYEF